MSPLFEFEMRFYCNQLKRVIYALWLILTCHIEIDIDVFSERGKLNHVYLNKLRGQGPYYLCLNVAHFSQKITTDTS